MSDSRPQLSRPAAWLLALVAWLSIGLFYLRVPWAPNPPFSWGGAASLIAAASLSGYSLYRSERRLLLPMLWVLLLSTLLETVGLFTDLPFGHYRYLPAAGPLLPGGLPLAIPAAWLALMLAARALLLPWRLPPWLQATGMAALMTAMDMAVDPIAVHRLGMWTWPNGGPYFGIPLQNYLGWFLVALVAAIPLSRTTTQARPAGMPAAVGTVLMLFFCAVGAGPGLLLPVAIALGFALWLALSAWQSRGDQPWIRFRT